MRLLITCLLAALMLVSCGGEVKDSGGPTAPQEPQYQRAYLDPAGAADAQIVLVDGVNDYSGQLLWYTGMGPVVTDAGQEIHAILDITGGGVSSIRTYVRDEYGNVQNCYDGAAVELTNPASTLTIVGLPGDSIIGDMRGIDFWGRLRIEGGITVVGRQDCAIEARPYATVDTLFCNVSAVGDTGYYGCNGGNGGAGLYGVNNNGTIVFVGTGYARWDYVFDAGVNTHIIVDGDAQYFGPRSPTNGDVTILGQVVDLAVPTKPGKRWAWGKSR